MKSVITNLLTNPEVRSESGVEKLALHYLNELSIPWTVAESSLGSMV